MNASNIKASRILIFSTDTTRSLSDLLLGNDGKIYVASSGNGMLNQFSFDSLNMHMGVIEYPNNAGTACNFMPYSFYLGGRRSFGCLPIMPKYELGPLIGSICDSLSVGVHETLSSKNRMLIIPNPASDFVSIEGNIEESKANVMNLFGQIVLTTEINKHKENKHPAIDTRPLFDPASTKKPATPILAPP